MTGRADWRSGTLLVTTGIGIACAAMVAFVTIDAPPVPARRAKVTIVTAQIAPPVGAAEIKLPAVDPPPAPRSAEFTAKPADEPAPPAPEARHPQWRRSAVV